MGVSVVPQNPFEIDVMQQVAALNNRYKAIEAVVSQVFINGTHYGVPFAGGDKPTLLKPGAEALCALFMLRSEFVALSVIEDFDNGVFFYRYECRLYQIGTDILVGSGIGSCNSKEDKYGYRWVPLAEVPSHLDPESLPKRSRSEFQYDFAIQKADTGGKYGKPAAYWQMFQEAIETGTAVKKTRTSGNGKQMVGYEIDMTAYRVPNPDICTQTNTIDKMAQKRALIAAVLITTGASSRFTQDIEDMPEFGGIKVSEAPIIDGDFYEERPEPAPDAARQGTAKPRGGNQGLNDLVAEIRKEAAKLYPIPSALEDKLTEWAEVKGVKHLGQLTIDQARAILTSVKSEIARRQADGEVSAE